MIAHFGGVTISSLDTQRISRSTRSMVGPRATMSVRSVLHSTFMQCSDSINLILGAAKKKANMTEPDKMKSCCGFEFAGFCGGPSGGRSIIQVFGTLRKSKTPRPPESAVASSLVLRLQLQSTV